MEILASGGSTRMRIAAYGIGTKNPADIDSDARVTYGKAKLPEDLALTPAG